MESLSAPPLFYLPSSPPGGVLVIMVIGIIFFGGIRKGQTVLERRKWSPWILIDDVN